MPNLYLFVYGTLMSPYQNVMARHFHQNADLIGKARMPGFLYRVSWYPGAVVIPNDSSINNNHWVYGELWKLKEHALFNALDRYEECSAQDALPHEYQRVLQVIEVIDLHRMLDAWVYLYQKPVDTLEQITTGRFRPQQANLDEPE
jgi:gamma-glutamylcyclotransferase (GGCT)/AIG2-like uncharacterized protein YtfP